MKVKYNLGVIGCGNMGSVIVKGVVSEKAAFACSIHVFDRDENKSSALSERLGTNTVHNTADLMKNASVILIAVKPQDSKELLKEISGHASADKLVVSIMAGVSISRIQAALGMKCAIARVMPNIGAFVGKSVSAVSYSDCVSSGQKAIVKAIFGAIGKVYIIKEEMQDAVTAVSGSGPAYFFYFIESLIDGAKALGFQDDAAFEIALETMRGSAGVLEQFGNPAELRKKVTSKGGTTEAAISVFDDKGLNSIIKDALKAAAKRSRQLAV